MQTSRTTSRHRFSIVLTFVFVLFLLFVLFDRSALVLYYGANPLFVILTGALFVIFFIVVFLLRHKTHEDSIRYFEHRLDQLAEKGKATTIRLPKNKVDEETRELSRHFNKVLHSAKTHLSGLREALEKKEDELRKLRGEHIVLEARARELQILHDVSDRISYSLDIPNVVEVIAGSMGKLVPYTSISYALLDEHSDALTLHVRLEEPVSKHYVQEIEKRMVESLATLTGSDTIKQSEVHHVISGSFIDDSKQKNIGSFFNGPIVIGDKPVGLLTVASAHEENFSENQMNVLYTITKQVTSAFERLNALLEEEKGTLNAMVSSITDGLLVVDTNMNPLVVNPALKIMLDLAKPDVTLSDVNQALGTIDIRSKLEEAFKLDRILTEDDVLVGQLYLRPVFSPVRNQKGDVIGIILILQDVTKERELSRLREDFTSMMVHELRAPLDDIKKMTELLKESDVKEQIELYTKYITMIHMSSSDMLELVNDLLDVAKIESGKFELYKERTDLKTLIEDRVSFFGANAKDREITLTTTLDPLVPPALDFDRTRISQVLNNLLSNALKFTNVGGTVSVAAFLHHGGKSVIDEAGVANVHWFVRPDTNTLQSVGDAVIVSVTDSGAGIPSKDIGKLFNKFQQFKASLTSGKKGTGLGLAVVKGVVEAHGGVVGVASEENKGTSFYFSIPL